LWEGNQATAKRAFDFTPQVSEKSREREARILRSKMLFEQKKGRKSSDREAGIWFHPTS